MIYKNQSTVFKRDHQCKPNKTAMKPATHINAACKSSFQSSCSVCVKLLYNAPPYGWPSGPNKSLLAQTEPQDNVWVQFKHQGKSVLSFNWQSSGLHYIFLTMRALRIYCDVCILPCNTNTNSKVTQPFKTTVLVISDISQIQIWQEWQNIETAVTNLISHLITSYCTWKSVVLLIQTREKMGKQV